MVDAVVFKNNSTSRLGINVASGSATITLEAGTGSRFPTPGADEFFPVIVNDRRTDQFEIMYCTQRVNDILTVDRAQEGTTAQNWLLGASVWSTATAGVFQTYFNYSYSQTQADARFLHKTGDVMTGALTLSADPTIPLHAATRQWVLAQVGAISAITEAPTDGNVYSRQSAGWVQGVTRVEYLISNAGIATQFSGFDLRVTTLENSVFNGVGTFAPTVKFGGAAVSVTYAANQGRYTKIGNRVFFNLFVRLTNKGSSVGAMTISGLPFAANAGVDPVAVEIGTYDNFVGLTGALRGVIVGGGSEISIHQTGATGTAAIVDTVVSNTTGISISGQYSV